jgi:enoyl-CoA hydratase/carnithine racemase
MSYAEIIWDVDAEGIGTLVINRPDRLNSIGAVTIDEMVHCLEEARADPAVRVVVLTGAGDRAFCAGADLGSMDAGESKFKEQMARERFVRLNELLPDLGKLVIAKIRGYALAGGLGLAVACDLAIAADTAVLGMPEIDVGIFPMMIMASITRNVPRKKAVELLFTGKRIRAAEAEALGLITRAVPEAELDAEVQTLARTLASKPPAAVKLGKDAFYASQDMEFRQALRYLQAQLAVTLSTEDAQEGLAAFREKRQPRWKGQ